MPPHTPHPSIKRLCRWFVRRYGPQRRRGQPALRRASRQWARGGFAQIAQRLARSNGDRLRGGIRTHVARLGIRTTIVFLLPGARYPRLMRAAIA